MLKAIDMTEFKPFSVSKDVGENKTVFLIGNLSQDQSLGLLSEIMEDGKPNMTRLLKDASKMREVAKAGLRGIRNFNGIPESEATDDVLRLLKADILVEVVGEIMRYNFASEEETKN